MFGRGDSCGFGNGTRRQFHLGRLGLSLLLRLRLDDRIGHADLRRAVRYRGGCAAADHVARP